jgi:hypothetical protein
MTARKSWVVLGFALAWPGSACTPSIPKDPPPAAMEFDPQAAPPRAPTPIGLVIDPATKHINLALARIAVSPDCASPLPLSQAECEFDTYLQSLDGFPTVTPGLAPATSALDPTTLTVGTNVVVVAAGANQVVSDVTTGFDATTGSLSVHPHASWKVGESYWIGVRGYTTNGVLTVEGNPVVGSPIQALLKRDQSLTCGATTLATVDPKCDAVALLEQSFPMAGAANALLLEQIRLAYVAGNGWGFMAANGLPTAEIAVLWGFPVHTTSVPELDPTVGLVPRVTGPSQLRVGVQGPVDPATVSAFTVGGASGSSVLVLDLDALLAGDLAGGFVRVTAHYEAGDIVVDAAVPFVIGHQLGVFMRRELHDDRGRSLVASPVSKLLTLRGSLVGADGHSTISSVADASAAQLEVGRQQLAMLFDNVMLASLTGGWLTREELIYSFAFPLKAAQ